MNKNVQTSIIQKKKNPKNLKTIQMSVNRMNVIIYSSIQQNTTVVENITTWINLTDVTLHERSQK